MIYKIYTFFFWFFLTMQMTFARQVTDLEKAIIPTSSTDSVLGGNTWADDILDNVLAYVRDSIFGLLALIAIGVFLYIGFKLITARWNPEEFKKALNTLIYAVIGLFVVSFAFAAVRLVAGLNI